MDQDLFNALEKHRKIPEETSKLWLAQLVRFTLGFYSRVPDPCLLCCTGTGGRRPAQHGYHAS